MEFLFSQVNFLSQLAVTHRIFRSRYFSNPNSSPYPSNRGLNSFCDGHKNYFSVCRSDLSTQTLNLSSFAERLPPQSSWLGQRLVALKRLFRSPATPPRLSSLVSSVALWFCHRLWSKRESLRNCASGKDLSLACDWDSGLGSREKLPAIFYRFAVQVKVSPVFVYVQAVSF